MACRFWGDAAGNMAMLAGFVMLPAAMVVGSGYDVMRATASSAKLRSVLESSALAAASLTNAREAEAVVADYMAANLVKDAQIRDTLSVTIDSDNALNSKTVWIEARASVPTSFMKIIGVTSLPVTARTAANQSKTTLELSLVLDISSSMSGSKLTNLKVAADSFIDQILNARNIDHTSVNLVPFGGTVNIDPIFHDYVVSLSVADVDPSESAYDIGSSVLSGAFRFTDGASCIEYVDDDYNDGTIPLYDRPQVPHFWKWTSFHPWCPGDGSAVIFNTNDKTALKQRIGQLVLSDGTGMDIGMMWGAKALSPDWRGKLGGDFPERPYPYHDEAMKVLVVMTDGEITNQLRPEDPSRNNVHTNRPAETNLEPNVNSKGANWRNWKNAWGNANNRNEQQVVPKGGSNSTPDEDKAVSHFRRLCNEAKANGVVVYSIGFNINALALLVMLVLGIGSVGWLFQHELVAWVEGCQQIVAADV